MLDLLRRDVTGEVDLIASAVLSAHDSTVDAVASP
jgi:hypothetical protein